MFLAKKNERIQVILQKLKKVKAKDRDREIFGSKSHGYNLTKVDKAALDRWLAELGLDLPEEFYLFLTAAGSGAGPYYGIHSLEKLKAEANDYFSQAGQKAALTWPCLLSPRMEIADWNDLVRPLIGKNTPDAEYNTAVDKLYSGMLCFGTQGCEYEMYLVLNGPYRGRIVYADDVYEDQPFFFTYEDNFLDWYERWLDEILLGYDVGWFGKKMPGSETDLLKLIDTTTDEITREEALRSLDKIPQLTPATINSLQKLADKYEGTILAAVAVNLICKTSLPAGETYLWRLLKSGRPQDLLAGLKALHSFGKSADLTAYADFIISLLSEIDDQRTLECAGYVLRNAGRATPAVFHPFLRHENPIIRRDAICTTKDGTDAEKIPFIPELLATYDENIFRQIMLYWGLPADASLLPLYGTYWPVFKDIPNFRVKFTTCLQALSLPSNYFEVRNES